MARRGNRARHGTRLGPRYDVARMPVSPPRLALAFVLVALGCNANGAPPPPRPPPAPSSAPVRWESKLGIDHPLAGVILDVAARRPVSEAELTARAQAADIVLVGEIHDNPDHHRLEAELLRAFATAHAAPAVVFEMLDREQQPAIDASLAAHPGNADALAEAVAWESSGWPAWSMYRPVFEAAIAAHGPILAAGLDREAAMRIAHDGVAALDPALVKAFGLAAPLPDEAQASMRHEMSDVHCGLLPESMLDSMVLVQRARDASLAERLHEGVTRSKGALLIAGAGHVRRDRGVPAQLTRAYGATSVAIGLLEVNAETSPEGYAAAFDARVLPFDFAWFTPRANDVDHCAELRAHPRKP
jgi:uncharacterized iron-regulated protein